MTDNEIIKALEHEISRVEYVDGFCADGVDIDLIRNALALINRQKAEIERLKEPLRKLSEIGYCHNFQDERSDLVSWIYAVCNVIKVTNELKVGKK